ncbi:MAG: hypothetical protein ACJ744_04445 [Gaiellaceae bacterium]
MEAAAGPPTANDPDLRAWCRHHLGSPPAAVLFETGHLSRVTGLRLADGREVVVKVRPYQERIDGCVRVQRHLADAGYPCPRPLAGPVEVTGHAVTAEEHLPGGGPLPADADAPALAARALAELVALAPPPAGLPLAPAPAWVRVDHHRRGLWPPPDDRDADLNADLEPSWVDEVGRRVRARLAALRRPPVVGHVDFEAHNLRWRGRTLHAVHDWDSVAAVPEAVVAGTASAVFTATGGLLTEATVAQSEAFLAAYEDARGGPFADDERAACWAAGLWVRAFNARKESLDGGGADVLARLAAEAPERLRRAGC